MQRSTNPSHRRRLLSTSSLPKVVSASLSNLLNPDSSSTRGCNRNATDEHREINAHSDHHHQSSRRLLARQRRGAAKQPPPPPASEGAESQTPAFVPWKKSYAQRTTEQHRSKCMVSFRKWEGQAKRDKETWLRKREEAAWERKRKPSAPGQKKGRPVPHT